MNKTAKPILKIGLIGCGRIAQLAHLKILPRLSDVELVAIADTDNERLSEAKRLAPQARTFTNYPELLATTQTEAVIICLPNALHAEATIAALNFNNHVYLEKPLATSLKDAERVIETWQNKKNLVGMIGFNYRFHRSYQAIKETIRSEKLARPILVRSAFVSALRSLPMWKHSRSSGGGVLFDLASHHIDLFRFLFEQEVCEVSAKIWTRHTEGDCALLHLSFPSGLRTQSFFSLCSIEENRFEIYDEAGRLSLETTLSDRWETVDPKLTRVRIKRLWNTLRSFTVNPYFFRKNFEEAFLSPYRGALINFADAIKEKGGVSPDFSDALQNIKVTEAAEESARTGKVVYLGNQEKA